jgi:hypothetical protein
MIADLVPDEVHGKIIAYEQPDQNRVNGYIATVDPAEDDNVEKTRDTSNLSLSIISKPYGSEPAKLVLEYCDRPLKLNDYYQELAYILLWWRTKIHIELNKGGWRMLSWFQENYPELLALLPASYNSAKGGVKMSHGYRITPDRKTQLKGLGDAYVENYWHLIPSVRLIDELKVVGAAGKDDDLAMAFLAGLMILQGDKVPAQNTNQSTISTPSVYHEKRNGKIELVTSRPQISTITTPSLTTGLPQSGGRSRLFKKL